LISQTVFCIITTCRKQVSTDSSKDWSVCFIGGQSIR
jgi:hypothetical protein